MQQSYEANDVEAFSRDRESHYFDRKSARKDAAEIAKHIMAFANAAGGRLVVGIEDDGAVSGFKREKAHGVEEFEQAPLTLLAPTPSVRSERVAVVNERGEDDVVLVLDVDFMDGQVVRRRTDSKVALREGDSSVWLDHDQITALEYDKGAIRYEDAICKEATLEDVDPEAVAAYKRAIGADAGDEQLLRSRHFLKGGHLTNAGVLLFAAEPSFILPQARVRVLKVDGTEMGVGSRMNIVKDETFDGPLVKALPAAKAFIASQLRDFQFQQPGGRFATIPEYPEFPWSEGLANAMAHRDYSIAGEYTRVYIYDDRMEIQSPGKLPNIVTLGNMRYTRYSRNPAIARVFTAFEWVRELNEGVRKIYEDMEAAGLPEPEFSMPNKMSVKLTLRNDIANRIPRLQGERLNGSRKGPEAPSGSLTANEEEALRIAREDGRVTTGSLAASTGMTRQGASAALKRLASRGLLAWHGSAQRDPHQYYQIP